MSNLSQTSERIQAVYRATFIHAPVQGDVEILKDHVLGVNEHGTIVFIEPAEAIETLKTLYTLPTITEVPDAFYIPGYIDTHCHAPQYQYAGTGTDRDLMNWLQCYAFPAEVRMKNTEYAREVYEKLVRSALKHGTTTAFYYGTIHLESTKILAEVAAEYGQRAFVGKVNMDQHSPDNYIETTADSLRDTELFIQYVQQLNNPLVQPVITPRFIPTCSLELLKGLSELARKYNVWIQSHISESADQVQFVKALHPDLGDGRCTGIFDSLGLLSDKCMMAHGTHLTPHEWNILKERGTTIAHCPLSNFFCSDVYLKLKPLLKNGNKVGLGTDIAGGYSVSILHNIRQSVIVGKVYTTQLQLDASRGLSSAGDHEERKEDETQVVNGDNTKNGSTISHRDAFYVATYGGAKSINAGSYLGLFRVGYHFDAQCIHLASEDSNIHVFPHDSIEDRFQKYINNGDDRNIVQVYVKGRPVKHTKNAVISTAN